MENFKKWKDQEKKETTKAALNGILEKGGYLY